MPTLLGWLADEIISAVQRNSVHGPPPEHWYPPKAVRDQVAHVRKRPLLPHQCAHCGAIDPTERRITDPYCSGRWPAQPTEVA